jgi:hypothetical protein
MDAHNLWWLILAVVPVASLVYVGINKLRALVDEVFLFKGLSIRVIDRVLDRGATRVVLKMAFVGEGDIVIDEVVVESKLTYPRRCGGLFAWLQLGSGYILDDVEGLNTVLGRSPPYIGLWGVPLHKIKNRYIRRPLSAIWGVFILCYFVFFVVFPLFWLILYWGPYQELRLLSGDEKVVLSKKEDKVQLGRPFIVKQGFEQHLTLNYRAPSLYYTFFWSRQFVKDAKVSYVKAPSKLRRIKLPRKDEFTWKGTDILRVKISGKGRRYTVNLGVNYANIHL